MAYTHLPITLKIRYELAWFDLHFRLWFPSFLRFTEPSCNWKLAAPLELIWRQSP